jgi:outer membrane protein assembly factor BamA
MDPAMHIIFDVWKKLLQTAGVLITLSSPVLMWAQESEERIVECRPKLYRLKRALHPLTWLEAGTRPIFRSAEAGLVRRVAEKPPRPPLRFAVKGTGSGSGFGPAAIFYDNDVLGTGIRFEAPLVFTYKHYEAYQFNASIPLASSVSHDRLNFVIGGGYDSRPSDNFFGIGNDSTQADKSEFRAVSRELAVGLSTRLNEHWSVGINGGYRNVGITHPRSDPSAQLVTWNHEIPGLFSGALLRSALLTIEHSTKDTEELGSSGGVQQLEVGLHEGTGKGDFSYWKYRVQLQHFFPLSADQRKVIAVRAAVETNQEKGDSQVPFFDMAAIGSSGTVRGFENHRFSDKSAVSFGIEYRYRIWPAFDWGIFLDEGQVAPEPGDFGLDRFHTGYGVRFIARPTPQSAVTIDVARSNEGLRFYIDFSPTF